MTEQQIMKDIKFFDQYKKKCEVMLRNELLETDGEHNELISFFNAEIIQTNDAIQAYTKLLLKTRLKNL